MDSVLTNYIITDSLHCAWDLFINFDNYRVLLYGICSVYESFYPFDFVLKVDLKINDGVFFFAIFIEYQNVILATILGELVRMKFSLWNINCPPGWKGGVTSDYYWEVQIGRGI